MRGEEPTSVREYSRAFEPPVEVDLERLRRVFCELMDAAAHDLQCAGYEQDDSIVERLVELRYAGGGPSLVVEAASLTDPERLLRPFREEYACRHGAPPADARVEMVAARARCLWFAGPGRPPA